jgi:hypothetical protein
VEILYFSPTKLKRRASGFKTKLLNSEPLGAGTQNQNNLFSNFPELFTQLGSPIQKMLRNHQPYFPKL